MKRLVLSILIIMLASASSLSFAKGHQMHPPEYLVKSCCCGM
ncbi:MAG: hypothetical protein SFW66_04320 [Gammaproteobacteria bacterium]|nr:hypothetical protein [Gammaproteobacteria bacterium]